MGVLKKNCEDVVEQHWDGVIEKYHLNILQSLFNIILYIYTNLNHILTQLIYTIAQNWNKMLNKRL